MTPAVQIKPEKLERRHVLELNGFLESVTQVTLRQS